MQVQTFTLHKCSCCQKTRKVYRDERCYYCVTYHDGESCLNVTDSNGIKTSSQESDLPSLEEINARIRAGEDTKEVWELKRKAVARENKYNKDATTSDSFYLSRTQC